MTDKQDHYQILALEAKSKKTIPLSELRQAYRQALLYFHPDKQATNLLSPDRPAGLVPTIDEITEAFKVLANPKLRAEYDHQRKNDLSIKNQINTRHTGMETVDLEDLDFDEELETWSRPCRCGSQPAFVVNEAELEKNVEYGELITGCKGCSLWLRVLFTVAD